MSTGVEPHPVLGECGRADPLPGQFPLRAHHGRRAVAMPHERHAHECGGNDQGQGGGDVHDGPLLPAIPQPPTRHVLAVYDGAGFTTAQADRAAAAVFMFVLGNAGGAAANVSIGRRLAHGGGDPEARLRETTTAATEVARKSPRLRDRIESAPGTGYNAAPDSSFEFGLVALLDGLQRSLSDG